MFLSNPNADENNPLLEAVNPYSQNVKTKDNPVLVFIKRFHDIATEGDMKSNWVLYNAFQNGYCWYFAHMLQSAFERGTVCLCAPFGHFVWEDIDEVKYDISGVYCGEAYYFIPESFMSKEQIGVFKHAGSTYKMGADDCIDLMKRYCEYYSIKYNDDCEKYLWNL